MNVLVFCEYYLPGYKAGGALRTVANIVDHLGEKINFDIVCRDRDLGDEDKYPGVISNAWNELGKCNVLYLSNFIYAFKVLFDKRYNFIYVNSFFSPFYSILPLVLVKLFLNKRVLLAPRGEFSVSALSIKSTKKKVYLSLFYALKFYKSITFQASSEIERKDILRLFPQATVVVAPDLPKLRNSSIRNSCSSCNRFRIVFLSRIVPIKNLDVAIGIVKDLGRKIGLNIDFDIYGPVEDQDYWNHCKNLIQYMPEGIQLEYKGAVSSEEVDMVLSNYDLLLLPSQSENYGHVIIESLLVGTPVLIGNNTPWGGVEEKSIGWVWGKSAQHNKNVLNSILEYSQTDSSKRVLLRSEVCKGAKCLINLDDAIAKNLFMFDVTG